MSNRAGGVKLGGGEEGEGAWETWERGEQPVGRTSKSAMLKARRAGANPAQRTVAQPWEQWHPKTPNLKGWR